MNRKHKRSQLICLGFLITAMAICLYECNDVGEKRIVKYIQCHDPKAKIDYCWNGPKFAENLLGRISYFQTVWSITIDAEKITDNDLDMLSGFKHLSTIFMNGPNITDSTLMHIGKLHNLSELSLNNGSFTDFGLSQLRDLGQLNVLDISYNAVDGHGLRRLSHLPIEHLDLCGVPVSDDVVPVLCSFARLKTLDVRGTSISREGMERLQHSMPGVVILEDVLVD